MNIGVVLVLLLLLICRTLGVFNFVCDESNSFFKIVDASYTKRFDNIDAALKVIDTGSPLLILAEDYPSGLTKISSAQLESMYDKNLTVFIEFPASFPGLDLETPSLSNTYFRTIVNDYPSLKYIKPETILKIQGKYVMGIKNCEAIHCIENSVLVTGRVAGYDFLPFGFPPSDQLQSILLQQDQDESRKSPQAFISLTSLLTDFYSGRYAPRDEFRNLFLEILNFMDPSFYRDEKKVDIIPSKLGSPVVPQFSKMEKLPPQANVQAIQYSLEYLSQESLLITPPNPKTQDLCINKPPSSEENFSLNINNTCMLSGYETSIDYGGNQPICSIVRIDCVAESSMSFALGGLLLPTNKKNYSSLSTQLMDYIYLQSFAQRKDPTKASYGLISWGMPTNAWFQVFYGDDNARSLISTILTASILKKSEYDESLLMGILGNFRTSSFVTGFRAHRLDEQSLEKSGWKVHFDDPLPPHSCTPHFDSYLWALFLLAYEKTQAKIFLEVAEKAIRTTMELYVQQKWTWTETMTEEQSRMLLPLAWFVRVTETEEAIGWLKLVASDLLASQVDCGAIREVFGNLEKCIYCPPKSNAEYGTHESPIIQENGDPASDLLYTSPFAMLGLLEAYYATNDTFYLSSLHKLQEFMIRIQVSSKTTSKLLEVLDGGWLRAFDFEKWEFWGSSGDIGWGAYSQTTGWTETWIGSVIAMNHLGVSVWDTVSKFSSIDGKLFDKICPTFFNGILYSKICNR